MEVKRRTSGGKGRGKRGKGRSIAERLNRRLGLCLIDVLAHGRAVTNPSTGLPVVDAEGEAVRTPPTAADFKEANAWLDRLKGPPVDPDKAPPSATELRDNLEREAAARLRAKRAAAD